MLCQKTAETLANDDAPSSASCTVYGASDALDAAAAELHANTEIMMMDSAWLMALLKAPGFQLASTLLVKNKNYLFSITNASNLPKTKADETANRKLCQEEGCTSSSNYHETVNNHAQSAGK